MTTTTTLRTYTCKDLAQMAKKEGVSGWHSMRKEELVRALTNAARRSKRQEEKGVGVGTSNGRAPNRAATPPSLSPTQSPTQRRAKARIEALRLRLAELKNVATMEASSKVAKTDRVVLMVRDAYWLQAHWDIGQASVARARTALGQSWHGASPILRIFRLDEEGNSSLYRDIEIHGGVDHWYVDVSDPPCKYRAELGYRAGDEAYYCVCRSNQVTTPAPGSADAVHGNWGDVADNADRIYAMSGGYSDRGTSMELQQLLEERLKCRLGRPTETRFGNGAGGIEDDREELRFAIDAELIVYGATCSNAHVTVEGEPVKIRPDGTFMVRLHFPNRRQVIPVVASAADGMMQKTIILGVERNTKELEPMIRNKTL